MDDKYLAKKYFIYGFRRLIKNENKCLVKDRIPSMRAVIEEIIELIDAQKEIDLKNALKDHLSIFEYYYKQSVLCELKNLKNEFNLLIEALSLYQNEISESNKNKINERNLILMLRNIKNKISKNSVYNNVIDLVFDNSKFGIIDKILNYIVNELIYEGYSLKFLDQWVSNEMKIDNISEETIDSKIEKFKNLKQEINSIKFYIPVYNKDGILNDLENIGDELKIKKVLNIEDILESEYLKYLQKKEHYEIFQFEVLSRDCYKALELINEKLISYYQLILKINPNNINIKITLDKLIAVDINNSHTKIFNKNYDDIILYSLVESKEKRNILKFINYRKQMYKENVNIDEINTMQRSLNLINNNEYSTIENRLINTWSSIEYILTYHSKDSIISKVKDVIPKLVVLYYMNEKIHGFFHRARRRLDKRKENSPKILTELIEFCCSSDNKRYDLQKFICFIDKYEESLIEEFEFDIVLSREIGEIGLILNNQSYRKHKFDEINQNTINEIIRIYRLRNVIVHSGFKASNNYNLDCLNLYQYGNNLLGMIIYFKDKNINSTLDEILHSISYSYKNYMEKILTSEDKSLICKPPYLFIQ